MRHAEQSERGTVEQRDFDEAALEARYINRCSCCPSLLGEMDSHRDELVPAFWSWRQFNPGGSVEQAIAQWAVERWGDRPYNSALGVLSFNVKATLAPADRKTYRAKPGTTEERKERLNDALDRVIEQRRMGDAA